MQALSLIEDGSGGLSARHRAVVEHAIADEHPWVAAIYDECKETGDVRGLMVGRGRGGRNRRVYGCSCRGVNPRVSVFCEIVVSRPTGATTASVF